MPVTLKSKFAFQTSSKKGEKMLFEKKNEKDVDCTSKSTLLCAVFG
jgi:hypothetical protein